MNTGLLLVLSIGAADDTGQLAGARRAADTIAEMGGRIGQLGERLRLAFDGQLPLAGTEPARLQAEMPAELDDRPGLRATVVMALSSIGPHPLLAHEFGTAVCTTQRNSGMFGPLLLNLLWLTDVHIHLGHYDDAGACAQEVLQSARASGRRAATARALAYLARIAAVRGDHGACQELAAEALTIAVDTSTRVAAARELGARDRRARGRRRSRGL